MRVLTWNLFHGRSQPPAGRDLFEEFAALLAGWDWDIALLQEVPPWWPEPLAAACAADHRFALTSRNLGLALRRALAQRVPDVMRSNGGGCNAVLTRGHITEHRSARLRILPERRVAQLVRVRDGTCLGNYHGSSRVSLAEPELAALWGIALAWAADAPLVVGGDLNLRRPPTPSAEILHVASRDVDHLFARGLEPAGAPERLDRHVRLAAGEVELSDHVPLAVTLRAARPGR